MEEFIKNSGLSHIGYKILVNLDIENQLECRLVCKAWKNLLEDPVMCQKEVELLLNKCYERVIFPTSSKKYWPEILTALRHNNLTTNLKFQLAQFLKLKSKIYFASPLIMFVKSNDLKMIKFILKDRRLFSNKEIPTRPRYTSLHQAVFDGHLEVVRCLKKLISPYQPNGHHQTPIDLAAYKGFIEIIKILVPNATFPLTKDPYGWNAIHFASGYGHYEIVKFFIKNEGLTAVTHPSIHNGYQGDTPLSLAIQCGHMKVAKLIVDEVDVSHLSMEYIPLYGKNVIHTAAEYGKLEILKYMIDKILKNGGKKYWLYANADGFLPIDYAIANGHLEIAKYLSEITSKA